MIPIYQFVVNKTKGHISKRVFQENKAGQFSEKRIFLTPCYVCVSRGKKYSFFGKFDVLCFLETRILRFALLPYYRRIVISFLILDRRKML